MHHLEGPQDHGEEHAGHEGRAERRSDYETQPGDGRQGFQPMSEPSCFSATGSSETSQAVAVIML